MFLALVIFFFAKDFQNTENIEEEEIAEVITKKKSLPVQNTQNTQKIIINKPTPNLITTKKIIIAPRPTQVKTAESAKNFSYQDPQGNIIINQVTIDDGLLIAHGDIIVGGEHDLDEYQSGQKVLKLQRPALWTKATIPYIIDSDLSYTKVFIIEAINSFHEKTSLKFIKRKNEENFIRFKLGSNNCYSHVGMLGGEQFISLSPACETKEITHELIHSLGFLHEQNRPDRDKYLKVLWENIDKINHLQFQKISNKFLDLSRYPFDYDSIMLYGSNFFSKYPDDYSIVRKDGTALDERPNSPSYKDWKKINSIYKDEVSRQKSP